MSHNYERNTLIQLHVQKFTPMIILGNALLGEC